jgi:hypothetical protein
MLICSILKIFKLLWQKEQNLMNTAEAKAAVNKFLIAFDVALSDLEDSCQVVSGFVSIDQVKEMFWELHCYCAFWLGNDNSESEVSQLQQQEETVQQLQQQQLQQQKCQQGQLQQKKLHHQQSIVVLMSSFVQFGVQQNEFLSSLKSGSLYTILNFGSMTFQRPHLGS